MAYAKVAFTGAFCLRGVFALGFAFFFGTNAVVLGDALAFGFDADSPFAAAGCRCNDIGGGYHDDHQ